MGEETRHFNNTYISANLSLQRFRSYHKWGTIFWNSTNVLVKECHWRSGLGMVLENNGMSRWKYLVFAWIRQSRQHYAETYSEPCQISKMEHLVKKVYGFQPLIIFAKVFILEFWQDLNTYLLRYIFTVIAINRPPLYISP